VHELRRSYRFDYLPAGFFSRLLVHLLQVVDSPLYWKHGIVLLQSNNNTRSKANQPCDGSSGGRSSSVAMASPAAARMASPSFSLSTASVLSSSPHMRELRRSGLDFDIFQNGGSGRRGQGLGIKKKQKKEKVKQRKESAEQSARGSGKESLGGIRAGQPDLDKDKLKDEQRALLEEFPEKSTLKVHVYGANPGKLLRLIEVPDTHTPSDTLQRGPNIRFLGAGQHRGFGDQLVPGQIAGAGAVLPLHRSAQAQAGQDHAVRVA
jgi:hypothetical protein